jgi:hypothetical protein
MADTFSTPEASPEKTQSKSSSKTVIILLILIVLAGIGLGATIAFQNRNNTAKTPEEANNVAPAATAPDTANISEPTSPVDTEAMAKIRAERVPNITVTAKELEDNSKAGGCWTIIDGVVYDTTEFLRRVRSIDIKEEDICGKDGTKILTEERNGQPPTEENGPFNPYFRPIGKLAQ